MFEKIIRSWKQYRYRFVPWIALNLKNRSTRYVDNARMDKLLDDDAVEATLLKVFEEFSNRFYPAAKPTEKRLFETNIDALYNTLGFKIQKIQSDIPDGGFGVGVMEGKIPKGSIAALYPGTIYQPTHPVFYQSIGNSYLFRCIDGLLVDGCDSGLSMMMYRSCAARESASAIIMCDKSWMTNFPANPLAVGQYVNNHTKAPLQNFTVFRCLDFHYGLVDSCLCFFPFGLEGGVQRQGVKQKSYAVIRQPFSHWTVYGKMLYTMPFPEEAVALAWGIRAPLDTLSEFPANVAYQEYDLPDSFPLHLRKYIPNVPNRRMGDDGLDQLQTDRSTRMVLLVSLRDIYEGEELFSSYYTLVKDS